MQSARPGANFPVKGGKGMMKRRTRSFASIGVQEQKVGVMDVLK